MKKTALIALSLFIILLAACGGGEIVKRKSPQSSSSSGETTAGYEEISCRKTPYDWRYIGITHEGGSTVSLCLPVEWSISVSNGDVYTISRDGQNIGTISNATVPVSVKRYEHKKTNNGGLTVLNEIHEVNSGNQTEYQRVIAFSYTADTQIKRVTLIVDYAELSKGAAGKIAESSSIVNTDKVISGEFTLKNPSKTVAVLGNSFVGSSRIGEFLNQMFAASQSGYNAFPVARGYANVGTYSNDEYFLSLIENGEFCAVFQCGFYSAGEVDNLRAIKKACEKSDTLLVIFPAHNEVDSVLSSARSQFPELPYVDWKGEINALIQNGVYYGQMCIDDSHQHTTPLGGYVGAHMIYRSLFGSVPPVISGISDCDYSYITFALGDYVYSLEGAKTTPTFTENLYFK